MKAGMTVTAAAPEAIAEPYEDAVGRMQARLLGHDAANRAVFKAEPAEAPDLVGVALRGARKDVDRATKGLALHKWQLRSCERADP